MESLIALIDKLDILIAAILGILGKFFYDKQRNGKKPVSISGEDTTLDSTITHRDSVMIWLTDRIHKVINEVTPLITRNSAAIEELKIKQTYLERDLIEQKKENAERIARLHAHIDERADKLEDKIDAINERLLNNKRQ